MKTLRLLFVILCCVGLVDGLALAAKGKKKKKKKAVAEESGQAAEGEVAASPSAGGDHGAQDKPGPYGHELGMNFTFSSNSTSVEADGEEVGEAADSSELELYAKYHYLLGAMGPGILGVGPIVGFNMTSTDASSNSGFEIGASAIYFIGELDTASWLPYVELNLGFKSDTIGADEDVEGAEDVVTSGLKVNVNGGVYYFLDAGVAATGGAFFDWSSLTVADSDPETTATTMKFGVTAGMSTFF